MDTEIRRDFVYSALNVVLNPILYYLCLSKSIQNVIDNDDESFSIRTIFYVWLIEIIKISVVTLVFPVSYYILDSKNDEFLDTDKLPFSKKDGHLSNNSAINLLGNSNLRSMAQKVFQILKGVFNLVAGIGICHVLFILFGAPFIQKWKLTLGFSSILVSWLYSPMVLVINPSSLLQELLYISSWKQNNSSLFRAKWRFLFTIFGTWVGAVVIPLDWDRPWQKWPISCVISSFVCYTVVNFIFCIYFMYKVLYVHNTHFLRNPFKSSIKSSHSKSKTE